MNSGDSGKYKIVATNPKGNVELVCNVQVKETIEPKPEEPTNECEFLKPLQDKSETDGKSIGVII